MPLSGQYACHSVHMFQVGMLVTSCRAWVLPTTCRGAHELPAVDQWGCSVCKHYIKQAVQWHVCACASSVPCKHVRINVIVHLFWFWLYLCHSLRALSTLPFPCVTPLAPVLPEYMHALHQSHDNTHPAIATTWLGRQGTSHFLIFSGQSGNLACQYAMPYLRSSRPRWAGARLAIR